MLDGLVGNSGRRLPYGRNLRNKRNSLRCCGMHVFMIHSLLIMRTPIAYLVGALLLLAGDGTPAAAGSSLDDFWNGRAKFEFMRMWRSPSDDNPSHGNVLYNSQAYIVPVGSVWYSFSREAISSKSEDANAQKPDYCKTDYTRLVLHTSTDQGATWRDRRCSSVRRRAPPGNAPHLMAPRFSMPPRRLGISYFNASPAGHASKGAGRPASAPFWRRQSPPAQDAAVAGEPRRVLRRRT